MKEELFFAIVFLIAGVAAILIGRDEPTDKNDPYLVKISLLAGGVFSIIISIYLLFKAF